MAKKPVVLARIVHSASVLFSRQGYHGTTTREIARLAQVSEVTVFRYFAHKEDIFLAALDSSFRGIEPHLKMLCATSWNEAPEVVLPRIVVPLLDAGTFSPELVRLVAVAILDVHGRAEEVCRERLARFFTAIVDYLETNIKAGRVRDLNPEIATVVIVLTTLAQPELSSLIGWGKHSRSNSSQTINQHSAFWVNALAPLPHENVQGIALAVNTLKA